MSRRRRNKPWWNTDWPQIFEGRPAEYESILLPRAMDKGVNLTPDSLRVLLRVDSAPVLADLRTNPPKFKGTPPKQHKDWPKPPKKPDHPGDLPTYEDDDYPVWRDYKPVHPEGSLFNQFFYHVLGTRSRIERQAKQDLEAACAAWNDRKPDRLQREQEVIEHKHAIEKYDAELGIFEAYEAQRLEIEGKLTAAQRKYRDEEKRYNDTLKADLEKLDSIAAGAAAGDIENLLSFIQMILNAIPLPNGFTRKCDIQVDDANHILLVTVDLPNLENLELVVELKTKVRAATPKELTNGQEFLTHALALRLLHEIFQAPELAGFEMAAINLKLDFIDRRTGQPKSEIIGSIATTRDEFANINIADVDPKLCFRNLKGMATPSFVEFTAVNPVLVVDRDDNRIIEGRDIVDGLSTDTNLAAMDWEDFEHIVRELFSKIFSQRSASAEVNVTRASRDYGVDALVYDPDPIHGGKFIIQAKRYVNTVEVAAVRDLYGTLQNEGANRGYLVTTSSFGPESYNFAKDKPLTLIDGNYLLNLLTEHGYSFRIDLKEARAQLHRR